MKKETSHPKTEQSKLNAPYIPVALGEIGRQIRLQMPRVTQQQMLDSAREVAQFRKDQAALRRGSGKT